MSMPLSERDELARRLAGILAMERGSAGERFIMLTLAGRWADEWCSHMKRKGDDIGLTPEGRMP